MMSWKLNRTFGLKYWSNTVNCHRFLAKVAQTYDLKRQIDWKPMTRDMIKKMGGVKLLKYYRSLFTMLSELHTSLKWNKSNRLSVPQNYWDDFYHQRLHLDKFALTNHKEKAVSVKIYTDWKFFEKYTVIDFGAVSLFHRHNGSFLNMLKTIYPELKWGKISRERVANNFWYFLENNIKLLEETALSLSIKRFKDWREVTVSHVNTWEGCQKNLSVPVLLCDVYREFNFPDFRRVILPTSVQRGSIYAQVVPRYWDNKFYRRLYLDTIAILQDVFTQNDWKIIRRDIFIRYGAIGIYNSFNSLHRVLAENYMELNWSPLSFCKAPHNFWNTPKIHQKIVNIIQPRFHLVSKKDWYFLYRAKIPEVFPRKITISGVSKIVNSAYPEEEWNYEEFSKRRNKPTRKQWLWLKIQKLCENEEVIEGKKFHSIKRKSGAALEFDVFIPGRNLAFEFHEEFCDLSQNDGISSQKYQDTEKLELCNKNGIKLIVVPFWWDDNIESSMHKVLAANN